MSDHFSDFELITSRSPSNQETPPPNSQPLWTQTSLTGSPTDGSPLSPPPPPPPPFLPPQPLRSFELPSLLPPPPPPPPLNILPTGLRTAAVDAAHQALHRATALSSPTQRRRVTFSESVGEGSDGDDASPFAYPLPSPLVTTHNTTESKSGDSTNTAFNSNYYYNRQSSTSHGISEQTSSSLTTNIRNSGSLIRDWPRIINSSVAATYINARHHDSSDDSEWSDDWTGGSSSDSGGVLGLECIGTSKPIYSLLPTSPSAANAAKTTEDHSVLAQEELAVPISASPAAFAAASAVFASRLPSPPRSGLQSAAGPQQSCGGESQQSQLNVSPTPPQTPGASSQSPQVNSGVNPSSSSVSTRTPALSSLARALAAQQ